MWSIIFSDYYIWFIHQKEQISKTPDCQYWVEGHHCGDPCIHSKDLHCRGVAQGKCPVRLQAFQLLGIIVGLLMRRCMMQWRNRADDARLFISSRRSSIYCLLSSMPNYTAISRLLYCTILYSTRQLLLFPFWWKIFFELISLGFTATCPSRLRFSQPVALNNGWITNITIIAEVAIPSSSSSSSSSMISAEWTIWSF